MTCQFFSQAPGMDGPSVACSIVVMNLCCRIMLVLLRLSLECVVFVSLISVKLWMLINLLRLLHALISNKVGCIY